MKRLHATIALAVMIFVFTGCNHRQQTELSNTALNSNDPIRNSKATTASISPISESNLPQYSQIELEYRGKEIEKMAQAWIEDAKVIAEETKDPFAIESVKKLKNLCYGVPGTNQHRPAIHSVDNASNRPGCIVFMTISLEDRQEFDTWNKEINPTEPLIYYAQIPSMVFNYEPASQLTNVHLRGLLIMHNMIHREQTMHLRPDADTGVMEAAAFIYELQLLDKLNLPGYQSFISDEMKKDFLRQPTKYYSDPRVERIFGVATNDVERMAMAQLLYLKIMREKVKQSELQKLGSTSEL